MKKKGLIISTVVMVIVLIASLTTATYAWFTASTTVSVSDLSVAVVSGADVAIGMAKTNAYTPSATLDSFVSGTIAWDGTSSNEKWTGAAGLTSTLNTGLPGMSVSKAVSTATKEGDTYTIDKDNWVEANSANVVKASGHGATVDNGTIEPATMNAGFTTEATPGDYISLTMGVQAVAPGLKSISCVITVDPSDSKITLGMNAAIRVRYRLNGTGDWQEEDVYDTNHYNTAKTAVTNNNTVEGLSTNSGAQSIAILIEGSDTNTEQLTGETISQLELVIFVAGYDTDCCDAAMGSAANIHINFVTEPLN